MRLAVDVPMMFVATGAMAQAPTLQEQAICAQQAEISLREFIAGPSDPNLTVIGSDYRVTTV